MPGILVRLVGIIGGLDLLGDKLFDVNAENLGIKFVHTPESREKSIRVNVSNDTPGLSELISSERPWPVTGDIR